MRIERSELDAALRTFASGGHGLVIGKPGVGKSYSLAQLGRELRSAETPFLFIAVDELGEATEDDLRSSLGYPDDFAAALSDLFRSSSIGVVIFDGFDAARSEATRTRVLQQIRRAKRAAPLGWSVLVSVRNYDAAKSPALLEAFPPDGPPPPPHFLQPRVRARHFYVPDLDVAEVKSAVAQMPALAEIFASTSAGFQQLMQVPFNLWLVERIMAAAAPERVTALESEVQLLDLFWAVHVVGSSDSDAKQRIASAIVARMVADRSLSVPKETAYHPDVAGSWRTLLSDEVLVEVGPVRQYVRFSHNILFDYAVSALAIDDDPEKLAAFLREDESRPLFLRPSLVYALTRLWYNNRDQFWACYWRLLEVDSVSVRLVARLIPPSVAARECRNVSDLRPLVEKVRSGDVSGPVSVLRVLQALRFAEVQALAPWALFAAELAFTPDKAFAWELGGFIARVLDQKDGRADPDIVKSCGLAARYLMAWVWKSRTLDEARWMDAFGAIHAVPLVLKTFETAPTESAADIRRVLELLREPLFPIDYLRALCHDVIRIASTDPQLVVDIYHAIFGHQERSDERTDFGGIILPMTSTRRQDYQMLHYSLNQAFPRVLQTAPREGIAIAFDVLNEHSLHERVTPYLRDGKTLEDLTDTFEFLQVERKYIPDMSVSWIQVAHHDDVLAIAHSAKRYLSGSEFALEPGNAVRIASDHAAAASTWTTMLETGTDSPQRFGSILHGLALARPVQLGPDTVYALGAFVEKAVQYWSPAQRLQFENSVLSLASESGMPRGDTETAPVTDAEDDEVDDGGNAPRQTARAVRIRDRLIARIPREFLVSDRAREVVDALAKRDALPANDRLVSFSVSSRAYSTDEWLKDEGVDVEHPDNVAPRSAAAALAAFADEWSNRKPTDEAVAVFLGMFRESAATVRGAAGAPAPLKEHMWTKLAAAASAIARSLPPVGSEAREIARTVLIEASGFAPRDEVGSFDMPHWSPSPRNEAIDGLAYLAQTEPDPTVLTCFDRFINARDHAERFLAVRSAILFYGTARDAFWTFVEGRVNKEVQPVVAAQILGTLAYAPQTDLRRNALARIAIERWAETDHDDLRRSVAGWLLYFACTKDEGWAWTLMHDALKDFSTRNELVAELVFRAINEVTPTALDSEKGRDAIDRAISWVVEVLKTLRTLAFELRNSGIENEATLRAGHQLVDTVVGRLYFNMQDAKEDPDSYDEEATVSNDAALAKYYRAIKPVFAAILSFSGTEGAAGMVAGTAHHFMETLNVLLRFDPAGVVATAAAVAAAGVPGRYHLDSLAIGEVVKLVETVLADHRERIASGESLADVLKLLDIFADAGWTEALQLVWRLDEAFR